MISFDPFILQAAGVLIVSVLAFILGLVIAWIIVSVPVYIAAKILTGGKARFTRAMLVTAIGPIVIAIVFIIAQLALELTIGQRPLVIGISFILAFIAWIGVFKKGFDTGWLRAFGIAVLASIVFIVIGIIVTIAIQHFVPQAQPLTPFPYPLQQA
ncbi:MAG: hypothetical protein ABI361_05195 [Nitrososphaera sp.]